MPFNWSVRSVENYSEISCATHMVGMNSEYPVFTVKDSSGYVIEEVKFTKLDDGRLGPLPNRDNEQELGLYLSRFGDYIMFHDLQFDESRLKFKKQVRREINEDDLVRRIGLSTNAMTQNKSEFNKWLGKKKKELINS